MPYVVNGGFGMYCGNRPRAIAAAVCGLFGNSTRMQMMSENALKLSHADATREIARDVGDMLGLRGATVVS